MATPAYASTSKQYLRDTSFEAVRIIDLCPNTYEALKRINFGRHGIMCTEFMRLRKYVKLIPEIANECYVVVARHREHGIVGWSMLYNERKARKLIPSLKPLESGPSWTGQFYVKRAHRCNGIGSKLYARMQRIQPTFYKYRHDTTSSAFFKKNGRR